MTSCLPNAAPQPLEPGVSHSRPLSQTTGTEPAGIGAVEGGGEERAVALLWANGGWHVEKGTLHCRAGREVLSGLG